MINFIKNTFLQHFSKKAPYWLILLIDCIGVTVAIFVAAYHQFGPVQMVLYRWSVLWGGCIIMVLFVLTFKYFHTYSGVIRFSSFVDLKNVAVSTAAASILVYIFSSILVASGATAVKTPDVSSVVIIFVITTMLMWFVRVVVKTVYDSLRKDAKTQKVFIYGVSTGALSIAKSIQGDDPVRYSLAGFVCPDNSQDNKYLMGVKIRRDGPYLIRKMKEVGATVLMVSPLQTEYFRGRQELINELIDAGIKIIMVPNAEEWDGRTDIFRSQLLEVDIDDLLPRQKIEINMDAIAAQLRGKKILITGAAGSIGSEMVRQVAQLHPSELILIDQAETPMHNIRMMMYNQFGAGCPDESKRVYSETIVASITDSVLMEKLFDTYRPEYVFHAAAYKHVPMMEDNPAVAVKNNIQGTRIIADLSVKYGVKKFVMISTDKAVNPTNVMGCSKRICEIYCQSLNNAIKDGKVAGVTQFVTTRFGNVLGSNGSVIPIFREQIAKGGPVTVTHPDIIRYFMLIPEACKLVLEAGTIGNGGEIFVFDMGSPVKIADLAKRMIALSGARNVKIEYTGLRDGEKLFEEVLSDKEKTKPTEHPKIMVASVREYDYAKACENEERLLDASYRCSRKEIVKLMQEIVPEYNTTNPHYQ